jgi:pimeloyl-ACP methyl ester carboxylesterase
LLDNGCYPLFLVNQTGFLETLGAVAARVPSTPGARGNDAWWEAQLSAAGAAAWHQLRRDALAAHSANGALMQLANSVQALRATLPDLEVHLLGHSTGCLALAHLLAALHKRRVPLASAHLYAPACSLDFANRYWLPWVGPRDAQKNSFPLYVSLLGDALERQDGVLPVYQKSLLYLVARSLEDSPPAPLLGMEAAWARSKLLGAGEMSTLSMQNLADFERAVAELTPLGLQCDAPLTNPCTSNRTDALGHALSGGVTTSHGSFEHDALLLLRSIQRMRRSAPLRRAIDLGAAA